MTKVQTPSAIALTVLLCSPLLTLPVFGQAPIPVPAFAPVPVPVPQSSAPVPVPTPMAVRFQNESRINQMEIEIDEQATRLLALDQPVAADLRFITATIKINSNLERMGDLAVNIAERAQEVIQEPELKRLMALPIMAEAAQRIDPAGAGRHPQAKEVAPALTELTDAHPRGRGLRLEFREQLLGGADVVRGTEAEGAFAVGAVARNTT